MRISRDGTRIAFGASVDGMLGLWVAPINDIDRGRAITAVTDRKLGPWIVWMYDDRHIVFFRDQDGDENWRAWRVDLQTADVAPLMPADAIDRLMDGLTKAGLEVPAIN